MLNKNANKACYAILRLNTKGVKPNAIIFTGDRIEPNSVDENLHIYEMSV